MRGAQNVRRRPHRQRKEEPHEMDRKNHGRVLLPRRKGDELNMSVSAFMDREKMKNQKGICQVRTPDDCSRQNVLFQICKPLTSRRSPTPDDTTHQIIAPHGMMPHSISLLSVALSMYVQEGFLNFIVLPLYKAWVGVFDEPLLLLSTLESNYQYWNDLAEQERNVQQPTSPP